MIEPIKIKYCTRSNINDIEIDYAYYVLYLKMKEIDQQLGKELGDNDRMIIEYKSLSIKKAMSRLINEYF